MEDGYDYSVELRDWVRRTFIDSAIFWGFGLVPICLLVWLAGDSAGDLGTFVLLVGFWIAAGIICGVVWIEFRKWRCRRLGYADHAELERRRNRLAQTTPHEIGARFKDRYINMDDEQREAFRQFVIDQMLAFKPESRSYEYD